MFILTTMTNGEPEEAEEKTEVAEIYLVKAVKRAGSLQTTIPSKIAEKYGFKDGDPIAFVPYGNDSALLIRITPEDVKNIISKKLGPLYKEEAVAPQPE